ncbi:MAG TPA: hypothetical protein VLH16_06615, partial [Bacteroidales bacterium]|nr:hypothetical protein [Bacteroidales bacterium]
MGKSKKNHTLPAAIGLDRFKQALNPYYINSTLRCLGLFILYLLINPTTSDAQFIGFEIQNRQRSHSFTFEKHNNLIVVPVV